MISLLMNEPLVMAQSTGSSREALNPEAFSALTAQNTGRFFRGQLAHYRRIIEQRGNIVEYRKNSPCHAYPLLPVRNTAGTTCNRCHGAAPLLPYATPCMKVFKWIGQLGIY